MSRVRDDARRNARREFAVTRSDGSPVGSYTVTYQDGCAEAFTERGDSFACIVGGSDHEPGSHTRENWLMRGPYSFDSFHGGDEW